MAKMAIAAGSAAILILAINRYSSHTNLTGSTPMSAPFGPLVLTLDDITKQLRGAFATFIDPRKGKNTSYTMVDAGLSAFSVFFMQSPSFLEYQRSLQQM